VRAEHQKALEEARTQLEAAARELERSVNEAQIRAQELAHERELREKAERERDDWHRELQTIKAEKESLAGELQASSRGSDDALAHAQDEHARALEVERAEFQKVLSETREQLDQARVHLAEERAEREGLSRALTAAQAEHAHSIERELTERTSSLEQERKLREDLATSLQEELGRGRESLAASDAARRKLEEENVTLRGKLASRQKESDALSPELDAAKKKLSEQAPVMDALADRVEELEREVNKLASRLGETKDRGKVDVKELLVRAALLKRREAKAAAGIVDGAAATPKPAASPPPKKGTTRDFSKQANSILQQAKPAGSTKRLAPPAEAPGPSPKASPERPRAREAPPAADESYFADTAQGEDEATEE
jgi:chromosome segregation ATPase